MGFTVDNVHLLEKIRDFRVALALLAFAALLDVAVVATTGSNLWNVEWSKVSRPGFWVLLVLAYSLTMTVGAGTVFSVATVVLAWVVPMLHRWLDVSAFPQNPDPQRYVTCMEAEKALAGRADAERPGSVVKQLAERAEETERWLATVAAGWACVALLVIDWCLAGSGTALLAQWQPWAPWLLLAIAGLPCVHQAWTGVPGSDYIDWPQLAQAQFAYRAGAFVPMPAAGT